MHLKTLMLALVLTPLFGNAQVDPNNKVSTTELISADLADVLAQVAWLSKSPMLAEIAQPLPRVEIARGTYVIKDLLQELVRQAPGYRWDVEGRVIYFYNQKLRESKNNFLNLKFPEFAMPDNVSELKLTFPQREHGLLQGSSGTGILITGFGDPALAKDLLDPATLKNVNGREILLKAANERPTFFTIVVFPNSNPTQAEMEKDINRNWFWQALSSPKPRPLYVQPVSVSRK